MMKTTEVIDFTKYRKGSRPFGRPIAVCPKCGRKGQLTTHNDGSRRYDHTAEQGPFALHIREHCFVVEAQ